MSGPFDLIVQDGNVVLPDEVRRLDIGIRDGKITALADRLEPGPGGGVLSAEGKWILPGVIDAHVHLNEPGLGGWEGFATGSAALAAGGCTTYIDMPLNGRPPTVNTEAFKLKLSVAEGASCIDYALWGGLVPGNGDQLAALAEAGAAGFKAFMSDPGGEGEDIFREVDDLTLYEGMKRIASMGGILALHAESEALVSALSEERKRSGRTGPMDYVSSRPVVAELEAVNRALFYAGQTGCALHFVHISSPQAVQAIAVAKRQGMDVTAETCPHYLILTCDDLMEIGPATKCAPPLRTRAEQDGLWEAVASGAIDLIASDHSPCPAELKRHTDWFQAWGGIAGAQHTLELMLHEGHLRRGIPLTRITTVAVGAARPPFRLIPPKRGYSRRL
ncbi:allantoinase AllB [Paenibacillus sp. P25]|nr:allantoinase AllB [Paenibacillus sp. P25]